MATAGVENSDNTASGPASHLSTLERKLTLQKTAVNQYQGALDAAIPSCRNAMTVRFSIEDTTTDEGNGA